MGTGFRLHFSVRRRRIGRRAALSAVASLAASLLVAGPAVAGGPGDWSAVSARGGVSLTDEPGLGDVGGDLGVVWRQQSAATRTSALRYRAISPRGNAGPTSTVISGWETLVGDPKVLSTGSGAATVLFSGLHSVATDDPYNGTAIYRADAGAAGTPWTLSAPTAFPAAGSPYGSYGTGAVLDGSTLLTSYPLNSVIHVTGSDGSALSVPVPDCCAYNTSLTRDARTGAVWLTWYANGSSAATKGTFAQQVRPSLGARIHLPGSWTTNDYGSNSLSPDQAVATTSRAGGGVFVAYTRGYPTARKIRVQRIGGGHVDVRARGADSVALGSSGRRVWLAWTTGDKVHVVRSNNRVTRFGAVHTVRAPGRGISRLAVAGAGRVLDVVVNEQNASGRSRLDHTQVEPGLTLKLSKRTVRRGGRLVARVTDAGAPVRNAKVRLHGTTKRTNRHGKVRFRIGDGWSKRRYAVVAKHRHYAGDKARVRVR